MRIQYTPRDVTTPLNRRVESRRRCVGLLSLRLTASEFNLARLVVHRVFVEDHIARQRQRQPLTVEDRTVRRQSDEAVGDGDGVKQAVLEVANEHVRCPHTVKLAMMKRYAAAVVPLVPGERQSLVPPDLTQVQRRRVFLVSTQLYSPKNDRYLHSNVVYLLPKVQNGYTT